MHEFWRAGIVGPENNAAAVASKIEEIVMKKQSLIITLAVTALFAAPAFAGSDDSDVVADIIDNQMVG